jgi:RHS repeat-associated protein
VRAVVTDEVQQDMYPAATLEGEWNNPNHPVAVEQQYYNINPAQIVPRSSISGLRNYPSNNGNPPANNNPNCSNTSAIKQTDNSDRLYRMNSSSTAKTGLGMTLKVMSGDKINIFGHSYYTQSNTGGNAVNTNIPVMDLINGLLQSGSPAAGKATAADINSSAGANINGFLQQPGRDNPNATARPKAFINYILLDDQFKFVSGNFSAVENVPDSLKQHYRDLALQNIQVSKNGYLYVYVSNESPVNVFFDNLQVIHDRGALLEETHYYPFGLRQEGICSKAVGKLENKEKTFQGQRFDDELGLSWVAFKWRNHDVQIGRFIEIDPLAEKYDYNSTYAFSENKVTGHVELEGLEAVPTEDKRPFPERTPEQLSLANLNVFAPLIHQGKANIQAEVVRAQYNRDAAKLGPNDKQARVELKERARANTPEPFKSIVETGRPIEGERLKAADPNFKGNATKTNIEVNETIKTTGVLGKIFIGVGLVQSGLTIANSDNPVRETVTETTGWAGAIYGGAQGAAAASAAGGPIGGFVGGAMGSSVGFFMGKTAVDRMISGGQENTKHNREIIPNWNPRPGGGLGN